MKKRLAALFLVSVFLILSLVTTTFARSPTALELEKEARSLEAYAGLLEDLELKDAVRISPHLPVMPEYYCGAYLDEQGQLNLMLKENAPISAAELMRQHSGSTILEHRALYSYNELNRVIAQISSKLTAPVIASTGVLSWRLDEKANRVVVELKGLSSEKIAAFRSQVSAHECIVFEAVPLNACIEFPMESTEIVPVPAASSETAAAFSAASSSPITLTLGSEIFARCTGRDESGVLQHDFHRLSIGMGATLYGDRGFFTAAHGCIPHSSDHGPYTLTPTMECFIAPGWKEYKAAHPEIKDSTAINKYKIPIGTILTSHVLYDTQYDSAFVKLNANVTVSPFLLNGDGVAVVAEASDPPTGIDETPLQGAPVRTCGSATTMKYPKSYGYILSANADYTLSDGTSRTNLIRTSTIVEKGDSGGTLAGSFIPDRVSFLGLIKSCLLYEGSLVTYSIPYATLKNYYFSAVVWNVAPLT